MAQDNRFDLTRLEQIERRLQVLEDAQAIRNLKARYAALCENQYDADGIASLFTEDAVWERLLAATVYGINRYQRARAVSPSTSMWPFRL